MTDHNVCRKKNWKETMVRNTGPFHRPFQSLKHFGNTLTSSLHLQYLVLVQRLTNGSIIYAEKCLNCTFFVGSLKTDGCWFLLCSTSTWYSTVGRKVRVLGKRMNLLDGRRTYTPTLFATLLRLCRTVRTERSTSTSERNLYTVYTLTVAV